MSAYHNGHCGAGGGLYQIKGCAAAHISNTAKTRVIIK
jgi:hypothetical protein